MVAGIWAVVRLGDGGNVDAVAPKLPNVMGPARRRIRQRGKAGIASGHEMAHGPFLAALEGDFPGAIRAMHAEASYGHGSTPALSISASKMPGSSSPRLAFAKIRVRV
jgi:hypothetical protein